MRATLSAFVLLGLFVPRAEAGPLLEKALAYSANFQQRHSPAFGCSVETRFAAPDSEEIAQYHDLGDSTIWTGNYVAAEAYRYAVAGDPEAKAFGLRSVECLLAMEEATGKPGFIARWIGPAVPPFITDVGGVENCTGDCHVVDSGPYAGNFWIGNTSTDQYLGWWYGLSHAMEFLLDAPGDAPVRARIADAMARVLDTLRTDGYLIVDPDGTVSTAGPEINGAEALSMHTVAARYLGGEFARLLPKVYEEQFLNYWFLTLPILSRWYEYFAIHLGHMSQHMLMRNETSWPLLKLHRNMHRIRNYPAIAGTQQVMFDYIAFGEKAIAPPPGALAGDKEALLAFPPPPKRRINPEQGPWTPDPFIDAINALGPLIAELLGRPGEFDPLGPQALEPFPAEERCATGFRWQSRPYELCGGDDAAFEYPGEDYLVAYWMGRWFGFLTEAD